MRSSPFPTSPMRTGPPLTAIRRFLAPSLLFTSSQCQISMISPCTNTNRKLIPMTPPLFQFRCALHHHSRNTTADTTYHHTRLYAHDSTLTEEHSTEAWKEEEEVVVEDNDDKEDDTLQYHSNTNTPLPLSTGAFQRLPMVAPSKEIIESALRRSERIGGNRNLKNEAARAKNRAARQLDGLMKELAAPLGAYERGFPRRSKLHPFENALLELTVGPDSYDRALARVIALKKATVEVAKGYAARASKASNKKEALAFQAEGFSRVESVFNKGADAIDELKELAKSLRRLPVVDPTLPTIALVGAPNVGKSSLVQLLSSGLPEVQNYPFTTRSIKMGHFYVDGRRHQVTDTPGLLNRKDEDRNAMERLTLASLQYLPTAVLFVADLTGECGTSLKDQWQIRLELRQRFQGKPWLDVFSKSDLLEEEFDEADDIISGSTKQDCCTEPDEITSVTHAVEFAAAVGKNALRVSSLTGLGIDELKECMLKMLEDHDLRNQGVEAWHDDVHGDIEMI